MNACAEFFNFRFNFQDIAEVVGLITLESQEFFLGVAQFRSAAAGQGYAPRMG
ncbi:hypothetical protein D3C73_1611660 [compost metagenome]